MAAVPPPKELALNKPNAFDGNPAQLEQFIMNCKLYLDVDRGVYDNDQKKTGFIMSLLSEGSALVWKMQYYKANKAANNGVFTAPTLATILHDLQDSFKEVDGEGSSLVRLEKLQQGG